MYKEPEKYRRFDQDTDKHETLGHERVEITMGEVDHWFSNIKEHNHM